MDNFTRNKKIAVISLTLLVVSFLVYPSFASNLIDKNSGGAVAQDQNIQQGVDFFNWIITTICGVGATIFLMSGFSNLKHGHYGPAALGITSGFGAGIATYLVHTYLLK